MIPQPERTFTTLALGSRRGRVGILSREQIEKLGFAYVGRNVRLSYKASYYGCARTSIGDGSRIDDFCVLSAGEGGISIGRYVHIAVGVTLIGRASIRVDDFCGLSGRVAVYSSSDDYSGSAMVGPTIPEQFTKVRHAPVHLEKHVIVGAGSVVLPGVVLHEGAAVGALSTVTKTCEPFSIYLGAPAKLLKRRRRDLLNKEEAFLAYLQEQETDQ